jgi:hypothetical protein
MILEAIQKVKLFHLLFLIDKDLAEQQRVKACPHCGASLHTSNYLRKPRGGPDNIPDELLIRHSFCCSAEECRKRAMPISCRFWDRKVYWGVIILALVTLQQGRTGGCSAGKLMRLFGISRHTLKRWMIYFRQKFPLTNRYKRIKGLIGFKNTDDLLPGALVLFLIERFSSAEIGLVRALQLLLGGPAMF